MLMSADDCVRLRELNDPISERTRRIEWSEPNSGTTPSRWCSIKTSLRWWAGPVHCSASTMSSSCGDVCHDPGVPQWQRQCLGGNNAVFAHSSCRYPKQYVALRIFATGHNVQSIILRLPCYFIKPAKRKHLSAPPTESGVKLE